MKKNHLKHTLQQMLAVYNMEKGNDILSCFNKIIFSPYNFMTKVLPLEFSKIPFIRNSQ